VATAKILADPACVLIISKNASIRREKTMSWPANHPSFPNRAAVQDALLLLLFEHGVEGTALWALDTYEPLADFFKLSEDARSMTRKECCRDDRKEPYWHTWVQLARKSLVDDGDLYPVHPLRRGLWRLTEQGKRRAARIAAQTPRHPFGACTPTTPVSPRWLKSPAEMLEDLGL
jgi:hypothetical protein